jgi:hypothetical protein
MTATRGWFNAAIIALVVTVPAAASAQSWKEIGKTASNSVVLIDTKSVKRMKDTVTATMRARFAVPDGEGITGNRTIATFNCAKGTVAVKENDSYQGDRVVRRSIPKIPGYGVVFGGSLTGIAFNYLCPNSKKP